MSELTTFRQVMSHHDEKFPKIACSVKGCYSKDIITMYAEENFFLCVQHFNSVPENIRSRMTRALARLRSVRMIWDNEERFDKIFESGKYLTLCSLIERTENAVHRVWHEMLEELIDSQPRKSRNRRGHAPRKSAA